MDYEEFGATTPAQRDAIDRLMAQCWAEGYDTCYGDGADINPYGSTKGER